MTHTIALLTLFMLGMRFVPRTTVALLALAIALSVGFELTLNVKFGAQQ